VGDDAVSRGIFWVNSEGNSGGDGVRGGSYWRGAWVDADDDRWLDFTDGRELLAFRCGFVNGFRWSDWGNGRSDYDVFVYDDEQATDMKAKGEDAQSDDRAPPIEHVTLRCNGREDIDHLAVRLSARGSGTRGDTLEFMTNSGWVAHASNAHSASGPVADSASSGALSVGAVDPAFGETIASYSARGPTNDGRNKPDLTAAACITSFTYGGDGGSCFDGTSAATPVVAGAAVVVLDAHPATTPAELKRWMLRKAVIDRGPIDVDNDYGAGELRLGAPPRARGTGLDAP
jgi:hypothetical protein